MTNPSPDPSFPQRRLLLFVLVLLFFAPVAIAFYLYYGEPGWGPRIDSTSHGELINPPRPLPEVALTTPAGKQMPAAVLRDHWSIVFVGNGACDAVCRQALYDSRQVRISLGREMERIQRVFLYTGTCCDESFFPLEHKDLLTASADTEQGSQLLERFPSDGGVPVDEAGRLYIVDPLGNLMMSYPRGANPKGMREDLKKLLKLSHIG